MQYDVQLLPAVAKWLEGLRDAKLRQRIEKRLLTLKDNPRPPGCEALAGQANRWRVRVGDYRVIYTIEDDRLLVLVITIGNRRDVYR